MKLVCAGLPCRPEEMEASPTRLSVAFSASLERIETGTSVRSELRRGCSPLRTSAARKLSVIAANATSLTVTPSVSATSTEGLRVVKVFLVDDHEVVRRGLIDLLSADPELEVVGEAGSVAQALARIPALAARRRRPRRAAARRQRHRTVPGPAVSAAGPAVPDADVVHLRRGDARRDTGRRQRIRRQGHQGHGTRPGHQGGRRGPFAARQPGRRGADGQAARQPPNTPIRCRDSAIRNGSCSTCSARA